MTHAPKAKGGLLAGARLPVKPGEDARAAGVTLLPMVTPAHGEERGAEEPASPRPAEGRRRAGQERAARRRAVAPGRRGGSRRCAQPHSPARRSLLGRKHGRSPGASPPAGLGPGRRRSSGPRESRAVPRRAKRRPAPSARRRT